MTEVVVFLVDHVMKFNELVEIEIKMKFRFVHIAGTNKLTVTWLEGYVYAYIYYCDLRYLSASITRGEFDLFVRPSAVTYYYKYKYTYGVHA